MMHYKTVENDMQHLIFTLIGFLILPVTAMASPFQTSWEQWQPAQERVAQGRGGHKSKNHQERRPNGARK